MAVQERVFYGWQGINKDSVKGNMVWGQFDPKTWTEKDVDIEIECCGICGSDIHTLSSGWKKADYPIVVGHEIIGRAVRVGREAEGNIKVGDRVGVGAQSSSCLRPDCEECSDGLENHCSKPGAANTYDSRYPDGSKATGGYANYARVPSHFVIKIPDALPSTDAAPMMCGGVTVYTPLVENGAGPGKRVGIIGIGGLGHFGILFAKALGCTDITAISRRSNKKEDALKMGATKYIATDEDDKWHKKNANSLDLIICTVSSHEMPMSRYLTLLRTKGQFIQVGAPEDRIPGFNMFSLIGKKAKIGGSATGSPKQIREMLELAVSKNVKPWINQWPLKDANQAIVDFERGKPRYRFVLVNQKGNGAAKL